MTVTTVYAANSGRIESVGTTYAIARAGTGTLNVDPASVSVATGKAGQFRGSATNYRVYETFMSFDTSVLPAGAAVTAVELDWYGFTDNSDQDFTIEARMSTWTPGGFTSADFVAGASLSGLTLVATFDTTGWSTAGYNAFTDVAFPPNINMTGTTEILLCSSRTTGNNTPTSGVPNETVDGYLETQAGTSQDPKLVITHVMPPTLQTVVASPMRW